MAANLVTCILAGLLAAPAFAAWCCPCEGEANEKGEKNILCSESSAACIKNETPIRYGAKDGCEALVLDGKFADAFLRNTDDKGVRSQLKVSTIDIGALQNYLSDTDPELHALKKEEKQKKGSFDTHRNEDANKPLPKELVNNERNEVDYSKEKKTVTETELKKVNYGKVDELMKTPPKVATPKKDLYGTMKDANKPLPKAKTNAALENLKADIRQDANKPLPKVANPNKNVYGTMKEPVTDVEKFATALDMVQGSMRSTGKAVEDVANVGKGFEQTIKQLEEGKTWSKPKEGVAYFNNFKGVPAMLQKAVEAQTKLEDAVEAAAKALAKAHFDTSGTKGSTTMSKSHKLFRRLFKKIFTK